MKKYFVYLKNHLFSYLLSLLVCYLLSFFTIDLINQQRAYYQASFLVENIADFQDELLIDSDFLNEIKDSGANNKYINIDVETMLEKNDFTYEVIDNKITIKTKFKYYDQFFLSSTNSLSSRAKMFIKDSVNKIAKKGNCNVTFLNEDIIELHNYLNRYLYSLYITLFALFVELIVSFFLQKKAKEEKVIIYDNQTCFKHCFNVTYWKLAFSPLKKVKDITTIAMIFALMMISKLLPLPSGFGNLGISFTYLFFATLAMIYGPVYGFIIGIFSDVIGFMINSNGGIFNFGYTLQAALSGFIYGICFYKRKFSFKNALLARLLVNIFMNAIYGSFLFIFVTYYNMDSSMTFIAYLEKVKYYFTLFALPKNIVYLLPQSILLYYVLRLIRPVLVRFKLLQK
ncbi:MAG: folate family ECF transporter S component [Erysipelotrichaceae bacterium]|nr:folate family ECF transporter S component [Erysipelotrichaceae bacterium]